MMLNRRGEYKGHRNRDKLDHREQTESEMIDQLAPEPRPAPTHLNRHYEQFFGPVDRLGIAGLAGIAAGIRLDPIGLSATGDAEAKMIISFASLHDTLGGNGLVQFHSGTPFLEIRKIRTTARRMAHRGSYGANRRYPHGLEPFRFKLSFGPKEPIGKI
jgi:hypothetical protein